MQLIKLSSDAVYLLVFSLQLMYMGSLAYFIMKSFLLAIQRRDANIARHFLTQGIILILSLQAAISLLKTLYFQSWEQMMLCASLIAMRTLINSSIKIIR